MQVSILVWHYYSYRKIGHTKRKAVFSVVLEFFSEKLTNELKEILERNSNKKFDDVELQDIGRHILQFVTIKEHQNNTKTGVETLQKHFNNAKI